MEVHSTGRLLSKDPTIDYFFEQNGSHFQAFNKRVSEIIDTYLKEPSNTQGKDKRTIWKEIMQASEEVLPGFLSFNVEYESTLRDFL